ncbi:MAG TPA: glutamate--tRNA ligase [Patescibacteria group bacterium]|jgi:glutamyl-tRNA synthetase|nr:glutamate--tRNA ligase [Patescibacteria group bacterium]
MEHSMPVRVRFAPAPTGMMHLGNVRAAVINFIFARQKNGVFVVRIEDTDQERNYDFEAKNIIADLEWLGLTYDEGPLVNGPFGPYFQSQRIEFYTKALSKVIEQKQCYRCFCSAEILEKKRIRTQALGLPPRYDRTCLQLNEREISLLLEQKQPFIWRFKLDHAKKVTVNDLAHGQTVFELHNFSDFPLTRSDGSFTFIFANFVDDMEMKITHIFRGEDHLTNSACQASLFDVFDIPHPVYLHMPILCNIDGKKLSKRDFGFSLRDLKDAGFLASAIVNYLAIIGGSFEQEIMDTSALVSTISFEHMHTTGHIKYDVEKLRWVNRKWIHALSIDRFVALAKPFLLEAYPDCTRLENDLLCQLLKMIQQDIHTLKDVVDALAFYFSYTPPTLSLLTENFSSDQLKTIKNILNIVLQISKNAENFIVQIKEQTSKNSMPIKEIYTAVRLMVAHTKNGMAIKDLIVALKYEEFSKRLRAVLDLID